MSDKYRDNIIEIKKLFNEEEKQYNNIQTLLIKLFDKKEYTLEEYKQLGRFLTENYKAFCEIKDYYIEMKKNFDEKLKNKEENKEGNCKNETHNKKEDNNYKEEKPKEENNIILKEIKNGKNMEEKNNHNQKDNKKDIKKDIKKIININKEELKSFHTLITYMKEFPDNINKNDKKNHFNIYKITKDCIDGFLGKIVRENINNIIQKKGKHFEKIDKKDKAQKNYEKIWEMYENGIKKAYSLYQLLQSMPLECLNEQQKFNLVNICIKLYNDLTNSQKKIIKEKYSKEISDKKISEILFLDFDNVFKVEIEKKEKKDKKEEIEDILENLSDYIEDNSKKYKNKNNLNDENEKNNKIKIINKNNVVEILLKIYKEYMYYKNKEKSYISLNENNIKDKIYFFLIINIITYKNLFITGENLHLFLYIKYWYKYKDFQQLISEKDKIQTKINIYTDEDLKEKEKNEKNLENEDIEEPEIGEDSLSSSYHEVDKILKNNLIKFIPEKYFKIYSEVLKKINNFYRIPYPINSLVNYDNFKFTFNIIDLVLFYEKYNGNNENETEKNKKINIIRKYTENLCKLEKDIFEYYKKSTLDYVIKDGDKNLIGYKINEKMKEVFNDLKIHLNNNLRKSFKYYNDYIINYIPFGSVTQFLNGENGDIDLFLDIKRISSERIDDDVLNRNKTEILQELYNILKKLDKNISFHQTNRLCLFTITFKNIKIDINVYGICSYYGEILLREYALLDFRFPMLVIYLKYIIKKKNIKNTEKDKIYINSFAWTNILLTFLQDILDPPLFPKLLNEDNKRQITIKVGGGIGNDKKKELKDEFYCQNKRKFNVIKEQNNLKEIESKFYDTGKNKKNIFSGKNQMCASEILLKFIQFIGYYFNYKYTIVNSSYEFQSFMPKIQKNKIKDEFTKFFFNKCKEEEEDLLLIREPFDYTYNPCKAVSSDNLEDIKKIFRKIYINILEKGSI